MERAELAIVRTARRMRQEAGSELGQDAAALGLLVAGLKPLLIGDGRRDLRLHLNHLVLHVRKKGLDRLLRILGPIQQVVNV